MNALRRSLLSGIVILNAGIIAATVLAIPSNACAGAFCADAEVCQSLPCSLISKAQRDQICKDNNPNIGYACCYTGSYCWNPTSGPCNGVSQITCKYRNPCP